MAPPPPLKYRPCHNPDGLVSEEALRIIVEAKACFVALALALAYFLTASQHRLWNSSHLVKGFLFAVTQPVTRFLIGMFTMLLAMPFRNDLYLLWGILLLAGYEGVYTISGYCVSARRSDLAVHEFARAYNIVTLGLYVRYYSRASQFRYPLWALMVAKFLERIVRFKIANARYGDANTSFVAEYMKHEDKVEVTTEKPTASFSMEDCNYLVVGDSMSKAKPERAPGDEDELKDVCLSFALCKLLRRKFAGVATAESERPKAQRLVFDNLIRSGWERTFRVVRTELGFARDLLYTKYPILFSSGFPVVSTVLFAVTVGVSVWITVSAVRHYRLPHWSTSNVVHGRNVDLLITFVIVGMVTGMEICELFIHLFSDWTKVMVISEYVQKPWLNCRFLNCILRLICCGKIAEPIGSSLGQFDLLKATKQQTCLPEIIVKLYHTARSFVLLTGDEGFRTYKCKTLRPVPDAVMDMICRTLRDNRERFTAGQERPRRGTDLERPYRAMLSDYCRAPIDIEAIMYCAYLLFYKPKLLPVASNSVRSMCKILVDEAKAIDGEEVANGGGDKEANGKQERSGNHHEAGVVSRGQALARDLLGRLPAQGDELWQALAELWCELIVSTAPHGNIGAHQKELGKGGEFITHLWALLYHAGIDDKFSGASAAAADAAPNGEDNNGQGGSGMCTAGSGGMTV
ncbi:hypothetical protein C2845_PM02G37910 [Panicum miliaceum]|uniref:DUF4220 domain-containing protein n=1 Tax=Panicum miliaceum TaxID=4540 RepID=A0A3L6S4K9_PANMI|nr:hypothetical protein C2845_PM02G37910 [Panicum miliaceum]